MLHERMYGMEIKYKSKILVSVIIPVYNAEKYLTLCMDSVLQQSLKEIQVICIDDGSADHSLQILEEYAGKDERVTVLHGKHRGAAAARNLGMEYACGQYVCFLDSDDCFEKDMIEELYRSARKYEAEIAVCEYDTNMDGGADEFLGAVGKLYLGKYAKKVFKLEDLPLDGFFIWNAAPWTKLYELDFLKARQLQFQQIRSANDMYFSFMAMVYANRIIHTSSFKALIHYRTNRKGQISGSRMVMDVFRAWKKVYGQISACSQNQKLKSLYDVSVLLSLVFELSGNSGGIEENKEFYKFFVQEGMEEIGLGKKLCEKELGRFLEIQDCFQKKPFESDWFLEKTRTCIQLEQKGFQGLKKLCLENRVALWGIGANGLPVLQIFEREGIRLFGVVDHDITKQGMQISGYQVKGYATLQDRLDIMMITSKRAFSSICSEIVKNNKGRMKVLPLFMWLESEMELRDCILEF